VDHYAQGLEHLRTAEEGLQLFDSRQGAAQHYASLAIGHALLRIAEALDRIGDDVDEIKRR
jgi:hypothetical protein